MVGVRIYVDDISDDIVWITSSRGIANESARDACVAAEEGESKRAETSSMYVVWTSGSIGGLSDGESNGRSTHVLLRTKSK